MNIAEKHRDVTIWVKTTSKKKEYSCTDLHSITVIWKDLLESSKKKKFKIKEKPPLPWPDGNLRIGDRARRQRTKNKNNFWRFESCDYVKSQENTLKFFFYFSVCKPFEAAFLLLGMYPWKHSKKCAKTCDLRLHFTVFIFGENNGTSF